jgi:hypothetical protein
MRVIKSYYSAAVTSSKTINLICSLWRSHTRKLSLLVLFFFFCMCNVRRKSMFSLSLSLRFLYTHRKLYILNIWRQLRTMRWKNKKETLKLFSTNWLDSFVYDWLCVYSQSDRHGQRGSTKKTEQKFSNSINVNDLFSGTKEEK